MSYDLQIWSAVVADIPDVLPEPSQWSPDRDVWSRASRGWQIIVGPQHRIEPEDIPEEVYSAVPGVQYMTELSLEPLAAPRSAHALLRRTAKALAASSHGAILDLQIASVTTPGGVRRFMRPKPGEVLDALELSWFSMNPEMRSRDWFDAFVRVLERELPEALPVRYGRYEPPQHRLRESGREHLVDFLAAEYLDPSRLGFIVWYPQRPVLSVYLSLGTGASRQGWRAQRITIDIDASALRQPGWTTAVQRIWRRIAHLTHAFHADARTLRNHGGTFKSQLVADRHPICSWFWAGIPRDGGAAVALGSPYLALWPEFDTAGEHDGDLAFLSGTDWTRAENVFDRIGGVPEGLAMQGSGYQPGTLGPNLGRAYPPMWPFGRTHL